jgi:hypothetical protein
MNLIALIKEKQAQMDKLQAELDEARALLSRPRVGGVASPSAVHPKSKADQHGAPLSKQKVGAPGIVPTSSVGLTVEVLRQAGKPLHIDQIIEALGGRGHKAKKTTLVGNLSRYVKRKQVFFRAAPSVFGLVEFKRSA